MLSGNKKKFFVAAISSLFKRQTDENTATSSADLDARIKAEVTFEDVIDATPEYDCSETDLVGETENSRLIRVTITYAKISVQLLAGWLAYFLSSVGSVTGTPADEVQTITGTATGGTFTATFNFEGKTGTTGALAYNVSTAALQAALEALDSIGEGNVAVSGAPGEWIVTFQGRLAKANMPMITLGTGSLTGGSASVAQTTAGTNKVHPMSRSTDDALVKFSMAAGFENDAQPFEKFWKLVCDALTITLTRRKEVTLSVVCLGRFTPEEIEDFEVPDCVIPEPLHGRDVRIKWNTAWITNDLWSSTIQLNNNVPAGDDAFDFDSEEIGELERGEKPTQTISLQILGKRGDTVHTDAKAKNTIPLEIHLGKPGERVSILAPSTKVKLAASNFTFVGDANRSAINVDAVPYRDETLQAPFRAEANIAQTSAFLGT